MEKKTNKAKLEIFKFLRKSILSQGNYALPANSIKICLLRYFCMQNSYLREKTVQNPTIFMKNTNKVEKLIILVISVNFLRFSLKLLRRISEKNQKICFLDGKEDKYTKIRNFQISEKISFIARL